MFVPVAAVALPLGYYLRRPRPPQFVAVSGIITLDGAPLHGAIVWFYPMEPGGRSAAAGRTDATGRFSLKTLRKNRYAISGALPGYYTVTVAGESPTYYSGRRTSPLTAKVGDGPNVFAFDLTKWR